MSHPKNGDGVLMRLFKSAPPGGTRTGDMCIVIRPQYETLNEELERTFSGREDVRIIVDRRRGDRRQRKEPVSVERRQAERRKPKLGLGEVVILS